VYYPWTTEVCRNCDSSPFTLLISHCKKAPNHEIGGVTKWTRYLVAAPTDSTTAPEL
jgi:hypothetical protein